MIGIDEAQFFEDLYDFCVKAADQDGKTVIVAGLDGDYLRYCLETAISSLFNYLLLKLGLFSNRCFSGQEELWVGARCNTSCRFCDQVDGSM